MGNYSSTTINKNKNKNDDSILNFKELNNNNSEFISKLNEIATDYILGQNFQDMIRLTNSKYCNDLVIITSKILKKSFFSNQIQVMYKQISEGDIYSGQSILGISGSSQKEQTKKMCIEIAKYYVKIAHLFAAIITTLNPVFSWRSSASSSRAILSPHIPAEPPGRTEVEQGMEGVEGVEDVEKTTLENKHYISEMAKDVKIENLNFCNSRIADLMDMDELTDLLEDESVMNTMSGELPVSEIKIKTKLCSSNLNNSSVGMGMGTGTVKTVYDLPGFAELSRLYNDNYNASKGRFDKMSAKSRDEKKRNIDLLYTLFTGNPNPPKDIKSFRDIPLHSFSDTADCSSPDSMLNKTYVGNTKDKLFVDYVEQVKKMIYDSNMIRNSLLEIIDSIFIANTSSQSDGAKTKYIIDPNLTYEELNNLIDETRKIILKLYVNCEKNFIHTLKILQGIIEAQMFETGQRQIRELEKSIDAEYAV